ncbi:MAG: hydrolase, partial [Bacteroidales bacterium]|nr:hydrolase [Candidatus Cryptobacteroides aphodequi]
MKRFAAIIAALALCASSALGQTAFIYTDATALPVFGKACPETAGPFTRLPASLKGVSRDPVWGLGRNSAGLFVRFTSDAGEFDLKWTTGGVNTLDNMTAIVAR